MRVTQRSFTGGEVSPGIQQRADLQSYVKQLAKCKNMIVRPQGGVESRPGTEFIAKLTDYRDPAVAAPTIRLIDFSFNTEQTYALMFSAEKVVIAASNNNDPDDFIEVVTPYLEDELWELGFAQSNDVLTICHHNHPPANLSRTSATTFNYAVINYGSTVSPPTGLVALAVGAGGATNDKTYQYVVTTVDNDGVESIASSQVAITTNALSTTYGVKLTWSSVAGRDYYKVYKAESVNTSVYGFIGETRSQEFTDFNIAATLSEAPPIDRTPFDSVNNYPQVVNYYQQRQMFANTLNEPQTVFGTQSGNYRSLRLSRPSRDDDAVTFTIAARQVNEIRHIVALDALILLTSGGEWLVSEGEDQVLTPSTISARIQSYNGCSIVEPATVNDIVMYVQASGTRIMDLNYTFQNDKYTGSDLTIMAEHLFEGRQIKQISYADEPYGVLWVIRDDGVLLGLTYQREHDVWAWHQHDTDGKFKSVASVTTDNIDRPYFVVDRTNVTGAGADQSALYLERLSLRDISDITTMKFSDSCQTVTHSPTPSDTITGIERFAGKEVVLLLDGNVQRIDVPNGATSITAPYTFTNAVVGLAYRPEIELLGIDGPQNDFKGSTLQVTQVRIITLNSRGMFVGPVDGFNVETPDDANLIEVKQRVAADNYDAIRLASAEYRVSIQPNWNQFGKIRIVQKDPLPMHILAVIPEFDIGG